MIPRIEPWTPADRDAVIDFVLGIQHRTNMFDVGRQRLSDPVVAFAALALLAGCATAPAAPPTTWREYDVDRDELAVVVATASPGDALPEPAHCRDGTTICMHSPFWFQAEVLEVLYGNVGASRFYVTSWGHYGPPRRDEAMLPRLMLLLHDGRNYAMPTYYWTWDGLARRRDGEYFLVQEGPLLLHWLPCDVAALRERLDARQFDGFVVSMEKLDPAGDADRAELSRYFAFHPGGATPRYGVSVSRLARYLADKRPRWDAFNCELSHARDE